MPLRATARMTMVSIASEWMRSERVSKVEGIAWLNQLLTPVPLLMTKNNDNTIPDLRLTLRLRESQYATSK